MKEKVLGAFGQYLCIPAPVARQNLFARPDHIDAEHATLLEPLACVVHGIRQIDWRDVEQVLILGLGSMGLLFAQLLPRNTNARLVGAGRGAARMELARCFGLKPVHDAAAGPLTADERFDVVIECTGKEDGWQEAFNRAAPGGQVLMFGGLPRGATFSVDSYRLHYEEIRILGDFHFSPADVVEASKQLASGELELDPLVSGCLPLERLPEALRRLGAGEGLQFAIDPWTSSVR
jgi:L-iditol 2-dehydrogenase